MLFILPFHNLATHLYIKGLILLLALSTIQKKKQIFRKLLSISFCPSAVLFKAGSAFFNLSF